MKTKIRNFIQHRKPKIKIQIKHTNLNDKKRGTKPNLFAALGIVAASSDEGLFNLVGDIAESPTPTKLLRHETILVGGTPKKTFSKTIILIKFRP